MMKLFFVFIDHDLQRLPIFAKEFHHRKLRVCSHLLKKSLRNLFSSCNRLKIQLHPTEKYPWLRPFCYITLAGNYMFKIKNRNTRTRCETCSKFIIKILKRYQALFWYLYCWLRTNFPHCSSVSIVNFEHATAGREIILTMLIVQQFQFYQNIWT